MSQRRYTVVHRVEFEVQLAVLYITNPYVQRSMDELEPVLRTIPDQAGQSLYRHDTEIGTSRMEPSSYSIGSWRMIVRSN